mmetsp:Transcript_9504/g.35264  ORF Transcript_9504/g.35264 Transcript_9504/m.35264 type:complete len:86 (-) Transcript_9504:1993-2250(-)
MEIAALKDSSLDFRANFPAAFPPNTTLPHLSQTWHPSPLSHPPFHYLPQHCYFPFNSTVFFQLETLKHRLICLRFPLPAESNIPS